MLRPARLVGFAPAGFLIVAAIAAAFTVTGGWTAKDAAHAEGYGIQPAAIATHPVEAPSGYGIDEVEIR